MGVYTHMNRDCKDVDGKNRVIVKNPGSQMGSLAAAEEGAEGRRGRRGEGGERRRVI